MRFAVSVLAAAVAVCGTACQLATAETLVHNQSEYFAAARNLQPGDTIVLANGEWRDFEIVIDGQGEPDRPVTLKAETKGEVIVTGRSNLRIAGEHIVVSGLVFTNGHSPTNTVISFRRSKERLASHSRVTEVVVDHFNNPERHEIDFWVMMYGKNNRFDHNHLEGKSNAGVTMAVRLDAEASQNNHHRIDHNYFGPRQVLGSNGGETLRIGTSKYSLTDSFTTVENNYFDRCNGEVEIISNKSGRNLFRNNVFFESRGTLTLRHGNDNVVEGNVFLGNGVDHTGGIRVINKRQTVRNNYLSGLTGHRFGGALVIMNGVPNSPINRYHQVEDSVVENNTILDSDHIELAAGSDEERSAVPLSTVFRNNLIVNSTSRDSIAVHDDVSGIRFSNNVVDGVASVPNEQGFESRQVRLEKATSGLFYPADSDESVGVSRSSTVLDRDDTGVPWYKKPGYESPFDTGDVREIDAGQDTLTEAIAAAAAGDIIELAPGEYLVSKILTINVPLSVRAINGDGPVPVIRFDRSTLFELADGGSLSIRGVNIDGSLAPDTYGNSAIRTSRYSMLGNYRLLVDDVSVHGLDTNHSFNFLKISGHTFAHEIRISNSRFERISGHVLQLHRETDDLGIYNAEYVAISGSEFKDIQGSVATIYRGGTDESTFGPHFTLRDSRLESVGHGKRNKSRAALLLHGVQATAIDANIFRNSEGVRVVTTVGEPVTKIGKNEFVGTPEPIIVGVDAL
jgi:poly(beta-D-mannuronate) lyase